MYFCITSQLRFYLLCFCPFCGRFRQEALQGAIVADQIGLIINTLHFTAFHMRILFRFHITHVLKGLVVLGRVKTGKDSVKEPFLMDCSRLNSILGENERRGFIWFLLFSLLTSFGLFVGLWVLVGFLWLSLLVGWF